MGESKSFSAGETVEYDGEPYTVVSDSDIYGVTVIERFEGSSHIDHFLAPTVELSYPALDQETLKCEICRDEFLAPVFPVHDLSYIVEAEQLPTICSADCADDWAGVL